MPRVFTPILVARLGSSSESQWMSLLILRASSQLGSGSSIWRNIPFSSRLFTVSLLASSSLGW